MKHFELFLEEVMATAVASDCPPRLGEAMRYSVFPGGARIRPKLALAVAQACGASHRTIALASAGAIELMHCASLVHDDLPCFDDADLRRGKPSVHRAFGEPLAVLAGDALIVLAFQTLAKAAVVAPARLPALVRIVGNAVGSQGGIVAGQAWEAEAAIDLSRYHRAKTGSLFSGATMAGAAAAGVAHEPWRALGDKLGEAFQVADDIRDVAMSEGELGKPAGQDAAHARPNAAHVLGLSGAIRHLDALVDEAISTIPDCPGAVELRQQMLIEARRFLPEGLARSAA